MIVYRVPLRDDGKSAKKPDYPIQPWTQRSAHDYEKHNTRNPKDDKQ